MGNTGMGLIRLSSINCTTINCISNVDHVCEHLVTAFLTLSFVSLQPEQN